MGGGKVKGKTKEKDIIFDNHGDQKEEMSRYSQDQRSENEEYGSSSEASATSTSNKSKSEEEDHLDEDYSNYNSDDGQEGPEMIAEEIKQKDEKVPPSSSEHGIINSNSSLLEL